MFTVRKLVLLALFAASALALQVSLSFLPNVEMVTLWFLLLACVLSFKESLVVVFVFSTLEALCKALDCQPGDLLEYLKEQ